MQKIFFHSTLFIVSCRPLVKSANQKNDFLISQPKHMLWVPGFQAGPTFPYFFIGFNKSFNVFVQEARC